MPYLLDLTKLESGDIILQSGSSKFSPVIKVATGSHFSHVMLYVDKSIIHALPDGVYSANPQRIIVTNKDDLKVLRLKDKLTRQNTQTLTTYARNLSGSLYNTTEAAASILLKKTDKNALTTSQFCSRLVAQCYLQVGISLTKNIDYCTPEDIHKSLKLFEVADCIREATINEIEFANSDDPIKENQRRLFAWLDKARNLFKEKDIIIQTENDVHHYLIEHKELDKEICLYLKESGYLEQFSFDKEKNPYRYNVNIFREKFYEKESLIERIYVEYNMQMRMIDRHSKSYVNTVESYRTHQLEYSLLLTQLYKNILSMSLESIRVLNELAIYTSQKELQQKCNSLISSIEHLISSEKY